MKTVIPDFNFFDIPEGFDSHVRSQLPWYELSSDMVAFIIRNYICDQGIIYDIGAASKSLRSRLESIIETRALEYISIDSCKHFQPDILSSAEDVEYQNFDIAVINLTMMFVSVKYRKILLEKLYDKLNSGGCIIIIDKFEQDNSYLTGTMKRLTLYWKYMNGVSGEDIIKKEISLSGIQIPMSKKLLPAHARQFFKVGEFEGFIITKE